MAIIETSVQGLAADESVHRLSTDEYSRIVATGALDGMRVELLDGLLVDMSPQNPERAWIIQQLAKLCVRHMDLLRVQLPLDVADGWVPEPDVALAQSDPYRHPTSALLVAEVAYSSRRVDTRKAFVYAAAGIPVYWLVDLPAGVVRVHTQPGPDGYGSASRNAAKTCSTPESTASSLRPSQPCSRSDRPLGRPITWLRRWASATADRAASRPRRPTTATRTATS